MAIEVHLIGADGFGGHLWRVHAPWIKARDMRDALAFEQEDALTWRARISRAECLALIDGREPHLPWQAERAAELRRRLWDAATREVEILLAEW